MNDQIRALIFEACNDWVSRGNLFTDDIQECFLNSTGDKGKYPFALDALAKMALAADQQPPQLEARQQAEEVERLRAELDALKAWKEDVEKQEPHSYIYRYMDPTSDDPVWLNRSDSWNGQIPRGCMPLYARPVPSVPNDLEPIETVSYWAEAYKRPSGDEHFMGHGMAAKLLDEYARLRAALAAAPKPEGE